MHEIPVNFYNIFTMMFNQTVNSKRVKTVLINTTGHEKMCFTVVLTYIASGTKARGNF